MPFFRLKNSLAGSLHTVIKKRLYKGNLMDKKNLMESMAHEAYERGVFNGIWLYAENGGIVSKGAYGFRDAEDKLPMKEDSIFQLASITKPFTASAVMLLVREGLLSLDDDITKFFPELQYKGVTIRHLLTHTSGVPEIDESDWIIDVWKEEKKIPSNSIILRYLTESGESPLFAPGEQFEYSNTGYCLLAEIVEKVSGVPFEDYMNKNIFGPAGMNSTGIYHILRDGIPSDEFVRNMVLEDGKYILSNEAESSSGEVNAEDGLNGLDNGYTTAFDMLRWDRALRGEKVLTRGEQQMMFTPGKLNNGEDAGDEDRGGYGYGWYVNNDPELGLLVAHSGGMPGLGTWYERGVDTDRVFVFVNTRDYEDVRAYWSFAEGMIAVSRDREPEPIIGAEDLAIKDPDRSKWSDYCGKYEQNCGYFRLEKVWMKDGDLYGKASNEDLYGFTFRLYPIEGNRFIRKGGYVEIEFGDGCLIIDDITCKKLRR